MHVVPVRVPWGETPRKFLNRLSRKNPPMSPAVGVSHVPRPTHVQANAFSVAFTEPSGDDDVLRTHRVFGHQCGQVFGEVGMYRMVITEIQNPVTGSRDR